MECFKVRNDHRRSCAQCGKAWVQKGRKPIKKHDIKKETALKLAFEKNIIIEKSLDKVCANCLDEPNALQFSAR